MPLFSGINPKDVEKSTKFFNELISDKKNFELNEIKPLRSGLSNRYLHLLLGFVAMTYGCRLERVKLNWYKLKYNRDIFVIEDVNRLNGEIYSYVRSSASLDNSKFSLSVTRFKDGIFEDLKLRLPDPDEKHYLFEIQKELAKLENKQWL